MKKLVFAFMMCMMYIQSNAKDGYVINANLRNNKDTIVYFCYYYGSGTTVQKLDSTKLTPGNVSFTMKGAKKITSGIYMLLFGESSPQIEFLLENGKDINMDFDKVDVIKNIKFTNDDENSRFYEDKKFIAGIQTKAASISDQLKSGKKKDTVSVNAQYEKLNESIFTFRDDLMAKNPKGLLATLYTAMKEPITPKSITALPDGRTKDSLKFVHYKENFWKDWNFDDDRLIYSPIYEGKLANYFRLVPNVPDSFNVEADKIMKRVKCNTDMYKFSFWWMTRNAGTSKVMGMDESYVYMIEKYVMSREYCGHLDSATKAAYISDAQKIGPNTMGKIGREIAMPDDKEVPQTLSSTAAKGDFTVLVFYDPTCHHCEKEVPSVDSVLNIIEKEEKITIMRFGLENADEDVKWRKFIADKKLNNHWVHVHNPTRIGNYRQDYNVYSNPIFYLLDKKGEIVGKRIDHTNIGGLIKHLVKESKKVKH
jgi:Domain of unknown function (DUF5106)/Domain of unknown function (DUF4369)/Thioredoxin-like